jgi:hypothetical protein
MATTTKKTTTPVKKTATAKSSAKKLTAKEVLAMLKSKYDEVYDDGGVYSIKLNGKWGFADANGVVKIKPSFTGIGEEWIEDGIKYIASEPYGLEKGEDFVLYLPDVPISTVSAEFLTWWPYRYGQNENPRETLGCYGILNVTTGYGFF